MRSSGEYEFLERDPIAIPEVHEAGVNVYPARWIAQAQLDIQRGQFMISAESGEAGVSAPQHLFGQRGAAVRRMRLRTDQEERISVALSPQGLAGAQTRKPRAYYDNGHSRPSRSGNHQRPLAWKEHGSMSLR
jgi:hypothetical protein